MNEPNVNPIQQTSETVSSLRLHKDKPKKTAQDWVRDMRMSAAVNKATTGVETDQVTPDLLLATSKRLLGISKREQEPDAKDSLAFQRFYGPEAMFSEHILRDNGKLGRNILWKATNKGNLDFMPVNALEKHISSVFYDSKLAQMMDGSSPLETIDSAYKTTRLGEGGIGSIESAPDEMRTVQPSYFGYIDPVRSPESIRVGLDVYMTKNVMKGTDGKLYQKFIDAKTGKEVLLDSETAANSVIAAPEMMDAKTKSIFALGGPTGIRIVPRSSVQYYLPRADEAYSTSSNLVTMLSGVKNMRLQMGCLHPDTYVIAIDKHGLISTTKAQTLSEGSIPGSTSDGASRVYPIRTTVAKFLPKKNWFNKIILKSGRSLITSADHKWPVLRKGEYTLLPANKLKPGDIALRTSFRDVPSRRTFVNHMLVNKELARVLGWIARSLDEPDNKKMRVQVPEEQYDTFLHAMERIGYKDGFNTYYMGFTFCVGIRDEQLKQLLRDMFGPTDKTRHIPTEILSAGASIVAAFLDGYTSDPTKLGQDSNDDIWVLDIPNLRTRDELAFLFARIETDTLYRDKVSGKAMDLALKLVPIKATYGDMIKDEIKLIQDKINAPIMIDIDIDDNLYATANGVVTHNSKYPLQSVSISSREAPLVRGLDEASGKDMPTLIGKYLGARFAPQGGVVTAVRKDRIDVLYDDGTKGKIDMYVNFPMNAKGYINNTPVVKAGQAFKKGDVLASSNYTDDKGVAALGTNLRTGWLSWKGGTYEDAVVISESAAKKLTSTTMYKTSVDLDKTVSLGKQNYMTWKPGEFTKEQMDNLDAGGVVKPGTVLHKEDPMILAVRTSEPSPGTMGKRVLTDLSERWEHDNPGVVTDVVKTRSGVKVYATVTAPAEIGDKLSGCFDDTTEVFTQRGFVLFKALQPSDKIAVLAEDGTARFEKPLAYQVDDYHGCMIEHKSRRHSMMVTPNHNIAHVPRYNYETGDTNLIKKTAADVYGKRIFMRVSASFDGVLARPTSDTITLPFYAASDKTQADTTGKYKRTFNRLDLAAFLGIYLAEGHCAHTVSQHWIRISQYDTVEGGKERCEEITKLLDRMGLVWFYYDHQYFMINNWPLHQLVEPLGNSYGKYIPDDVFTTWSKEEMLTLLDWFYIGDGEKTLTDGNAKRCATVSKRLADDLQRLYILTGQYSNVHSTSAKNAREGIVYKVSSAYKSFLCVGMDKKHWRIVDDYTGKIYCVTSSTGIILTRRDGIVSWNGQSYGNKGTISQIVPDDEMPRNAKGEPLEMLFSPLGLITRCYDEETEFLTKAGWKFGKDITDEDEFYCYDTATNTWDWGKQLEPFHTSHYKGTMYEYHGRVTDFSVTANHKVWAQAIGGQYKQTVIQDIYGKEVRVPCVADRSNQPVETRFELPLVDGSRAQIPDTYDAGDWAEFMGWYLSEGCASYQEGKGRYEIDISQYASVNPIKVKLLKRLFERLGLPFSYSKDEHQFRLYNKRLAAYLVQFGHCHEKFIPAWLFQQPDYVIHRFLDGMLMGDGSILPSRTKDDGTTTTRCRIKLTSEKLIDQLQMLFCMVGIATVKTFVGPDPRYPESKDQYYLGVSMTDSQERRLDKSWSTREYDGMVYCPTVNTGYILTRRHGKVIVLGNTNPSQLYEAQLGKIARKTGKPITVPAFMKGSLQEFVSDQLKQNNLKPDEDLINPETGLPIKDVLTGVSYIYKLKHMSESKLSARGTDSYDAEGAPAGKGMEGCFPAAQVVYTRDGRRTIAAVAKDIGLARITSVGDDKTRRFAKIVDRFVRMVPAEDLLHIMPTWSYTSDGQLMAPTAMCPTKNHAIYMYDMTQKHAVDVKPGDRLAGLGNRPSEHQMQVIWNLMHQSAIVDHDTLYVPYDPEAHKLAKFKVRILRSLKATLKDGHIVLPHYRMYQAALEDTDNGDLAIALNSLDKAAKSGYEISSKVKQLIAVWIPWNVIPEYAYAAKQFAKEQQKLTPVAALSMEPHPGVMPIIVARVTPYKTKSASVKVYDLTVEETHRYVLNGGFLVSNSKRFGTLEQSALIGHQAENIIQDAKWVRGQSNSDFWRSLRTGDIPTMPGEPLVHKKFFAHLTGAGINVRKTPQGVSIFALTDKDVSELAGPRELRSRDTYEARNFRPIDGGLFGQDIFGINGDKWAYIQLDEPVPNPVMEEPLARLLNIPEKKFADVAAGKEEVNGIRGGEAMKAALEKLDLQAEAVRAHQAFKTASPSNKDKALKRYIAIERMRRAGVNPGEYMLDKIPVLPPVYRPISSHNGLTMVADSNYLYAQLLDARDDMREAKGLPLELQQIARENLYNKWKELTGLYAPSDVKLQSKHVQGLLKWALGDSPKFGGFSRKVLSATVDTVGRGAITPDSRLKLNEVGLPEIMAFNIMAPMVERSLVKRGYTPIQAMKMVKERTQQARDVLDEVMKDHPVIMNRAPTLHKLSVMAFNPKLVSGHAIRVNPSIVVPFGADFDGDANIGRICILITSEFLRFVKNIEENSNFDLTLCKRMLHYMYSQIKQPLAERSTYMSYHNTSTLIRAIEESGIKQVVMDIDLADMPHGALTTKNGGEKHNIDFYEAAPGIKVMAYEESTGEIVWADVAYWSEHHNLPVEIVHLVGGRDIITDDDPRAVYGIAQDAKTLVPQRFTPTEAKAHNVVVPCMKPELDINIPEVELHYVRESDGAVSANEFIDHCYKLDFAFGQLLGTLAGDGWWDKKDYQMQETFGGTRGIRLSDNEGYNAAFVREVLSVLFGTVSEYKHEFDKEAHADRYGDTVRYSWHHEGFSTFNVLLTNMLGGVGDDKTAGSGNKHLPMWFKAAPYEFRRGLLCGLLATDGSICVTHGKAKGQLQVSFTSTSLRLCREMRDLCWSLGVSSSITFSKTTTRGNKAWIVSISTYDLKKHDNILDGLCHERKLKIYQDTEVVLDAAQKKYDYRPFPEMVANIVFKWFKSPNIEKELRQQKDNPEYLERLRISNMYLAVARYRHSGYITKYGVELIEEYINDCITKRGWAIQMLNESLDKLQADVHCELTQEWKVNMWKALHILKDQLPADVASNAKTLVTRRAMLGKGCQSLLDALLAVSAHKLETSEFGLGMEPLFKEWLNLCTNSDCIWMPIKSIEKTGQVETGYDLTVPGYETFVSSEGVVLSNTVNIHAPVSDKARQEAYARMFPERNLIAMRSRTIAYKPEKEYQQGLYIGTRIKQGADVRTHYFNTLEEAKEAYRQGLIDIDDPIEIKSK